MKARGQLVYSGRPRDLCIPQEIVDEVLRREKEELDTYITSEVQRLVDKASRLADGQVLLALAAEFKFGRKRQIRFFKALVRQIVGDQIRYAEDAEYATSRYLKERYGVDLDVLEAEAVAYARSQKSGQ